MDYADLELTLHRHDAGLYGIDLRLADPSSETDRRLSSTVPVRFDDAALRKVGQDPAAYGSLLASQILAEEAVRTFFGEALAAAQASDAPLALRLAINPNAAELHSLRWETLRLPNSDASLLTGEHLRFSRYLSSLDWRPVRLRPQADLRALVAIASPSNLASGAADFWSLDTPNPITVTIALEIKSSNLYPYLSLYSPAGVSVGAGVDTSFTLSGSDSRMEVALPQAGRYLIRVAGQRQAGTAVFRPQMQRGIQSQYARPSHAVP